MINPPQPKLIGGSTSLFKENQCQINDHNYRNKESEMLCFDTIRAKASSSN